MNIKKLIHKLTQKISHNDTSTHLTTKNNIKYARNKNVLILNGNGSGGGYSVYFYTDENGKEKKKIFKH